MPHSGESIGPYTLITKLGSGGFGVVWLAERRTAITTTKVALKYSLDDEIDLTAIKHEADLWAQASGHPNIVPIIEANVYDGHVVIISEYSPGGTLASKLAGQRGTKIPVDAAIEMVLGILAGLNHLHSKNIIHRDLKPANILLHGEIPRLADFGISRVLKATKHSSSVAGTPVYMAPEAFNGVRSVQTDIWSVGIIFYELLVGQLPYPPADYTTLVATILMRDPEPLPLNVPAPVEDVLRRALSKDVAQRFKSASEMRRALLDARQLLQQETTEPTRLIARSTNRIEPPSVTTISNPRTNQGIAPHYVYAATAIVIALLFIGGFFLFFRQRLEQEPSATPMVTTKNKAGTTIGAKQTEAVLTTSPRPAPTLATGNARSEQSSSFRLVESAIINNRSVSSSDLNGFSQIELRMLRNTVYARHGKPFQTPELQRYFEGRPWYSMRTDYSIADLTANDQANIKLIQSAEK